MTEQRTLFYNEKHPFTGVLSSYLIVFLSHDPAGFIAAGRVVAGGQVGDDNAAAGVRRVDELAVADIHADVAYVAVGVEAQNVAGLKIAGINMDAVARLILRDAVELVSELAVHIVHQTGAVKAGGGRGAAPDVIIADKLKRVLGDLTPKLGAASAGDCGLRGRDILAVNIAGLTVDNAGRPVAGDTGDAYLLTGVVLAKYGGREGRAAAEANRVAADVRGGRFRLFNGSVAAGLRGSDVLAVNVAGLAVNAAGRPVAGATGYGKLLAAVIAVYNAVAGGGAGTETDAVAAYVSRRLDNGVRLRSGFGRGFRSRFRSRLRSRLRGRLRSGGGGLAAVALQGNVLAVNIARLTVYDAGSPVSGITGDAQLLAGVILAQYSGIRGRAAAETDIHGVDRARLSFADHNDFRAAVFAAVRLYAQVHGGHEAVSAVIIHGIPTAVRTIGHSDAGALGQTVEYRIPGTRTAAEVDVARGDGGILGEGRDHQQHTYKQSNGDRPDN